jgi:hypothetical protein
VTDPRQLTVGQELLLTMARGVAEVRLDKAKARA